MALSSCADNYWDRLQGGQTATIPEGIFVNWITGSDTTGTGSYKEPYATIFNGINEAVIQGESAVHVAAGVYAESVTLVDGVSLYGGYSAFNWTDRKFDAASRNIAGYRTVINPAAGNAVTGNVAITTFTIIEGFVIQSMNADGIQLDFGASPTIRDNTIYAGAGASINGIEVNGSSPSIVDNIIYADDGTTSEIGINLWSCSAGIWSNEIYMGTAAGNSWGIVNDSSNNTVSWNTIYAGTGSINSFGIWNNNCGAATIISYNSIDGGTGPDTRGIRNDNSPVTIAGNWINGGVSSGTSYGISNFSSIAKICSNAIYGGNGGTGTFGIWNNSSSAEIYNNTIDGGDSPGSLVACISINNCAPRISNNIIHISGAGITTYGIFEMIAAADPAELRNNDIYGCPTALYHDADGWGDLIAIFDVNDFTRTTQGPPSSGNVSIPLTLSPYGRITAGFPAAVIYGGLDGVAEGWGFNTDRDNDTRTVPWSMGAYEYD